MSEKKFAELWNQKDSLAQELKVLEKSIFDLETKYLEETAASGNVLRGWEGYTLTKNQKIGTQQTRKQKIGNGDRIFSQSSRTAPIQQLEIQDPEDKNIDYRPKRTKRKKNYANYNKKEQVMKYKSDQVELSIQSSSDEFDNNPTKKTKGTKKF
ncbi:hypothetical protein pb186bvf_009552 [Paramecium bursaria]